MWKLVELKCTHCEHQFEEMIDTEGPATAECPICNHTAIQTIGLSAYGKHGSWSEWRAMHNDRG